MSEYTDVIYDEDYTGPRWRYGLRNRPLSIATAPKGWIIRVKKWEPGVKEDGFLFGTVDYPRPLTEDEMYSFELTFVSKQDGDAVHKQTEGKGTKMTITTNLVGKTIDLELVGLDGNAFALMGAFSRQAKHEGWTREEIETVLSAAKSGDYNNLIAVLDTHCEPTGEEDDA